MTRCLITPTRTAWSFVSNATKVERVHARDRRGPELPSLSSSDLRRRQSGPRVYHTMD